MVAETERGDVIVPPPEDIFIEDGARYLDENFNTLAGWLSPQRYDIISADIQRYDNTGESANWDNTNTGWSFNKAGVPALAFKFRFPWNWTLSGSVYPHVVWEKVANGIGDVCWQLTYWWINLGLARVMAIRKAAVAVQSTDLQDIAMWTPWELFAPTSQQHGAVLTGYIQRLGADPLDTYIDVARLISLDILIQGRNLGALEDQLPE